MRERRLEARKVPKKKSGTVWTGKIRLTEFATKLKDLTGAAATVAKDVEEASESRAVVTKTDRYYDIITSTLMTKRENVSARCDQAQENS